MNIGIDIDDTITNNTEVIDRFAKEYTEQVLNREFKINTLDVVSPMWAQYVYGWTEQENDDFWNQNYEKVMENAIPKEDAIECINRLSQNHQIIIITARWDKENGIISKITNDWLKNQGIHYDKIFMGHEDKRKTATENNIDIFIDDNYKTCKQISDLGIRTFIMNSRLNKDIQDEKIERVFSWKEIEQKIKEEN